MAKIGLATFGSKANRLSEKFKDEFHSVYSFLCDEESPEVPYSINLNHHFSNVFNDCDRVIFLTYLSSETGLAAFQWLGIPDYGSIIVIAIQPFEFEGELVQKRSEAFENLIRGSKYPFLFVDQEDLARDRLSLYTVNDIQGLLENYLAKTIVAINQFIFESPVFQGIRKTELFIKTIEGPLFYHHKLLHHLISPEPSRKRTKIFLNVELSNPRPSLETSELCLTAHEILKRWHDQTFTEININVNPRLKSEMAATILSFEIEGEQERVIKKDVVSYLQNIRTKPSPRVFQTGLSEVDQIIGGFPVGEFSVVAGRPGMGKLSFLCGIALNAARSGEKITLFSLHLSGKDASIKIASTALEKSFQELLKSGLKDLSGVNFLENIMVEEHDVLEDVKSIILNGSVKGVKLILIDDIHLIKLRRSRLRRDQEIQKIISELRSLAKTLKVAIVSSCQVSRSVEVRGGDKRPTLGDLKESGALEEMADKVLLLYRPEYYGITQSETGSSLSGVACVLVEKNKTGPIGEAIVGFDGKTGIFHDLKQPFGEEVSSGKNKYDDKDDSWVNNIERDDTPF